MLWRALRSFAAIFFDRTPAILYTHDHIKWRWPSSLNCRLAFLLPGLTAPRVFFFTHLTQNGVIVTDMMRQGFPRRRPVLCQHRREDLSVLVDGFNRRRGVTVFPMEQ